MTCEIAWLKDQDVWIRKEKGIIVDIKKYIGKLQKLSMDNSRSTEKLLTRYINKYKYVYYQDLPCDKYNNHWSMPPAIIKKIKAILVIFGLGDSVQARKMGDYMCGYMYGLEEKYKTDVRCFGDFNDISKRNIANPHIRLVYLTNKSLIPKNISERNDKEKS